MARHSTALRERRYRCYLPVLAEFTRLLMHGTWPPRTMRRRTACATPISLAVVGRLLGGGFPVLLGGFRPLLLFLFLLEAELFLNHPLLQ